MELPTASKFALDYQVYLEHMGQHRWDRILDPGRDPIPAGCFGEKGLTLWVRLARKRLRVPLVTFAFRGVSMLSRFSRMATFTCPILSSMRARGSELKLSACAQCVITQVYDQ